MKEILVINPKPRKKKPARKTARPSQKGTKMAKRKRRTDGRFTKSTARKTTKTRKRSYRKNPGSPPRRRRAARASAGRLIGGLNFREALRVAIPVGIGMFAAKFAAKRFGAGGSEIDPNSWTWKTYLQGAAGAALAGILSNMVRPGMGQKVFQGGIALMAYKLVQNELIVKNDKAVEYLGGADDPALLLDLEGVPYMLGPGGSPLPLDEQHRMDLLGDDTLVESMYGEDPDPNWGDVLSPTGPLGLGEYTAPPSALGSWGDSEGVMSSYRKAWV